MSPLVEAASQARTRDGGLGRVVVVHATLAEAVCLPAGP